MNATIKAAAALFAIAGSPAWAHTDERLPPHGDETVAVRCHLEAGCEIKAVAYLHESTYCDINSLEGDACKCPGRKVGSLCVVAEATITQDFREWREISVGDFQFNPQLRVGDIEVETNGQLFGVYTDKAFRYARWANYRCWRDSDADGTKHELEDCGQGQARAVQNPRVE